MTQPPWVPPSSSRTTSRLTEYDFVQELRRLSAKGTPVTRGLIVVFVLFYLASLWVSSLFTGMSLSPTTEGLDLMGAMRPEAVAVNHQWFRLLMATVLHGGVLHIAMNSYALFIVGRFLEPLLGGTWYFALFALGGLGGSVLGLYVNSPGIVSVGASGAIMGLFAMLGICSLRVPPGRLRTALRVDAIQVLIPSLLPLGISIGGAKIDYAAHLGGALAGIVGGAITLLFWRDGSVRPSSGGFAKAFCAIAVFAYLASVVDAGKIGFERYEKIKAYLTTGALLMPNDEYKGMARADYDDVQKALKRYPKDPRLLWKLANFQINDGKYDEAIATFKRALTEKEATANFYNQKKLTEALEVAIGETYLKKKDLKEAKKYLLPHCANKEMLEPSSPEVRKICASAEK